VPVRRGFPFELHSFSTGCIHAIPAAGRGGITGKYRIVCRGPIEAKYASKAAQKLILNQCHMGLVRGAGAVDDHQPMGDDGAGRKVIHKGDYATDVARIRIARALPFQSVDNQSVGVVDDTQGAPMAELCTPASMVRPPAPVKKLVPLTPSARLPAALIWSPAVGTRRSRGPQRRPPSHWPGPGRRWRSDHRDRVNRSGCHSSRR